MFGRTGCFYCIIMYNVLSTTHSHLNQCVLWYLTLHSCGTKALASKENCVIVVFGVIKVSFLLHKCPAAHILKAPWWVATFNEADWLKKKSTERERERKNTVTELWLCKLTLIFFQLLFSTVQHGHTTQIKHRGNNKWISNWIFFLQSIKGTTG